MCIYACVCTRVFKGSQLQGEEYITSVILDTFLSVTIKEVAVGGLYMSIYMCVCVCVF